MMKEKLLFDKMEQKSIRFPIWFKVAYYLGNKLSMVQNAQNKRRKEKIRRINKGNVVRGVGCSYSHVYIVLQKFEEKGFLSTKRNGREVNLFLTEKGRGFVDLVMKLKVALEEK